MHGRFRRVLTVTPLFKQVFHLAVHLGNRVAGVWRGDTLATVWVSASTDPSHSLGTAPRPAVAAPRGRSSDGSPEPLFGVSGETGRARRAERTEPPQIRSRRGHGLRGGWRKEEFQTGVSLGFDGAR